MTKCPFPHWLGQPNVILVVCFVFNLLTMIEKKKEGNLLLSRLLLQFMPIKMANVFPTSLLGSTSFLIGEGLSGTKAKKVIALQYHQS